MPKYWRDPEGGDVWQPAEASYIPDTDEPVYVLPASDWERLAQLIAHGNFPKTIHEIDAIVAKVKEANDG